MADFAELGIRVITDGAEKSSRDLNMVERAAKRLENALAPLTNTLDILRKAMAISFVGTGVAYIMDLADRMQSLNSQLKFVTSSQQEFNLAQKELFQIAQMTRASLESTSQLYIKSSQALRDYGYAQKDILQFTETMNKAMAVGGVSAEAQASALFQLSQALGSGQLQGDEFKTIAESAPIILDVLAEYMGKSRAEVKKLASEGKLTSKLIFDAFNGSTEKINEKFKEIPLTFGGAMQQLQNAVLKFVGDLDSAHGLSGMLAQGISFLAENFATLAKALGYATAAYVAYNTVSMVSNFKNAHNGVGILAASFGSLTTMIRGATVAMMANPIGLLTTAIIGAAYVFDEFLSDTVVGASKFEATWGDVATGVWEDFKEVVSEVGDWFIEQWDKATSSAASSFDTFLGGVITVASIILEVFKSAVNGLVGLLAGAAKAAVVAWDNFPAAMEALAVAAFNGLVSLAEKGINALMTLIKAPLDLISSALRQFGGEGFDTSGFSVSLNGFKLEASKQAKSAGESISAAFADGISTDYVGSAIKGVSDYLVAAGDRVVAKRLEEEKNKQGTKPKSITNTNAGGESDKSKGGKNKKGAGKDEADKLKKELEEARREWLDFYDDLRLSMADSYTKIGIEQDKALRELNEKFSDARLKDKENLEKFEEAKKLIREKYHKEYMALAEKHVPELQFARELKEQLKEIQQLEKGGFLTGAQADKARDNTKWDIGEQTAKQAGQNAVSGYDRWKEQFDPMQGIKNEQATQLAELQSFYDQGLIQYQDFVNAKAQIDNKATQDTQNLFMGSISGFGGAIDTMLGVMRNAGQEQSGIYRTMFAMSKAFAIADSIMKIQQGIANAAAQPFPANLAAMASVASATANIVSSIQSVSLSGMAHSGIDSIPKEGTWLLDRGERVVDSRTNQDLKTFLSNQGKNTAQSGKQSVNVQIINNGTPVQAKVTSEEKDGNTQITVELLQAMQNIAKTEADKAIMNNFARAGGAFRR